MIPFLFTIYFRQQTKILLILQWPNTRYSTVPKQTTFCPIIYLSDNRVPCGQPLTSHTSYQRLELQSKPLYIYWSRNVFCAIEKKLGLCHRYQALVRLIHHRGGVKMISLLFGLLIRPDICLRSAEIQTICFIPNKSAL